MPQSLSRVSIHLVFSTKLRTPFLRDPKLRADMCAYLGGALRNLECAPAIINGTEDHVHFLFDLSRVRDIAKIVKEIKRQSSIWVKDKSPECERFHWQDGYGAFSVSYSNLSRVYKYISEQEKHHTRKGFQPEFRRLLETHGLEWDERYVWD